MIPSEIILLQIQVTNSDNLFYKVILAIIGGIIGSYLTRLLNRNRERVTLAFDFHKEFNNYEVSLHRRKADRLITQYPNTNYDDLANLNDESSISVFVILRFFQRLSQAIKYKQAKEKIILNLFSDAFYFWYYISYQKNLSTLGWLPSRQIDYLANWFKKELDPAVHSKLKNEILEQLAKRLQTTVQK